MESPNSLPIILKNLFWVYMEYLKQFYLCPKAGLLLWKTIDSIAFSQSIHQLLVLAWTLTSLVLSMMLKDAKMSVGRRYLIWRSIISQKYMIFPKMCLAIQTRQCALEILSGIPWFWDVCNQAWIAWFTSPRDGAIIRNLYFMLFTSKMRREFPQ